MDIKLMHISKKFKSVGSKFIKSLDMINIDINYGNYLSFVGPSGSGKSTLLNIITSNIKPTSGEIFWGKYRLSATSQKDIAYIRRTKFGIIFQDNQFMNDLSVEDNVLLPLVINGSPVGKKYKYYNSLMESLIIDGLKKRFPFELSGGEKKKVSIARSLINNPEILVADEPTANLDEASALEVFNIFSNLNKLGLTIVIATHDERFGRYCKETYFLVEGKIDSFKANS
jgi:putative ABC transport system ATP-binding protein